MDNKIRTGQILSPFGIGQIINLPKELSVMVCGLDLWRKVIENRKLTGGLDSIDEDALFIDEPRLAKLLGVDKFIKPFVNKKKGVNSNLDIPAVRFPGWHHCTNPGCGKMSKKALTMADDYVKCQYCDSKMIPVRFIAACKDGHIQDVPFIEWVHDGTPTDGKNHVLKYISNSGSGDLGSIYLKCSCGAGKSLAGLMNVRKEGLDVFDSALARIGLDKSKSEIFSVENPNNNNVNGQYCKGHQPWLGTEGIKEAKGCPNHLHVLIRGGSNVHYSDIISAINLPQVASSNSHYAQKVIGKLNFSMDKLKRLITLNGDSYDVLSIVLDPLKNLWKGGISEKDLIQEIVSIVNANSADESDSQGEYTEDDLRYEEYEFFLKGFNSESSNLKAIVNSLDNYQYSDFLNEFLDSVVLVEKLKETRVFTGFSRIQPINGDRIRKIKQLSKDKVDWLPAYEVFGEGIFMKFKEEKLREWEEEFGHHFSELILRNRTSMTNRGQEPTDISPIFIMMHTLSHLIIKRLCFNCGYGSSSLRERIYYSRDHDKPMYGFLIYTSSGDSEGSLGGLVRQGKEMQLGKLIKEAIADADWCSADPVCSEIGQKSGQGPDNINGSACHNCCIVPETSCEKFNTMLDRATIVGTHESPELGFFHFWEM